MLDTPIPEQDTGDAAEAPEVDPSATELQQVAALTPSTATELQQQYEQLCDLISAGSDSQEGKAAALQWLSALTPEQLQNLAAEKGFQFPQLVGLTSSTGHPLVHWLDPNYDTESQAKIQAVALQRWSALCAGETVNGQDLQTWQQNHPTLPQSTEKIPEGWQPWQASAADIIGLQSEIGETLLKVPASPNEHLPHLIDLENRLATAVSSDPDLAAQLPNAVASARHQIDSQLATLSPAMLTPALNNALDKGQITAEQANMLSAGELFSLARASTPEAVREQLLATVADRTQTVQALKGCVEQINAFAGKPLTKGNNYQEAQSFIDAVGKYGEIGSSADGKPSQWLTFKSEGTMGTVANASSVHVEVKKWCQESSLADLRAFAVQNGLTQQQAKVATKSSLTKYFAAKLFSPQHAQHYSQLLQDKWQKKYGTPQQQPKAATPPPAAPVTAATGTGSPAGFAATHASLVQSLRHVQASHQSLPARIAETTISSHSWGTGQPGTALGGSRPKSIHTGPDGAQWMFKSDLNNAALSASEAAASRVFARAGLPSVPVYTAEVAGKTGSVQPLLKDAAPVSSKPSKWTQADVDSLVRMHVASWAIGDHDGHHDNVLRTDGGGLVPIDQGQAFKHFGRDALSLSYTPSARPVYHDVYRSHLSGKLAPGVKVTAAAAHPVLKKFEAIPNAEWREMLTPIAKAGASSKNVSWYSPMQERAATKHGIKVTEVTETQIANAFLDYAVERKSNLRATFSTFFGKELNLSDAPALAHM